MDKGKEDWTEHVKYEKVQKYLSLNVETLGKVKQFQEDYQREKTSKALVDLVYLGLANLGYYTKEDVDKQFVGFDIDIKPFNVDKPSDFDLDSITDTSTVEKQRMNRIINIISRISNESESGYASRQEIIVEGEAIGLSSEKVSNAIEKMKRNGQVYEPVKGKYRLTCD